MGRTKNTPNNNYHFKVFNNNNIKYHRTISEMAEDLKLGTTTISRILKNPDYIPRKYKDCNFKIERCKIPIYDITIIKERIEY